MKIFAYPNILKCGKLFSLLHILTKSNLAENGKNLMMLNVSFVFSWLAMDFNISINKDIKINYKLIIIEFFKPLFEYGAQ